MSKKNNRFSVKSNYSENVISIMNLKCKMNNVTLKMQYKIYEKSQGGVLCILII